MRLHKTDRVCIRHPQKDLYGPTSTTYVLGLVDKTNTLSLVHRENFWHVSIQKNGMRLYHCRKQSDARIYMEYLLEHAYSILNSIPLDPLKASEFARSGNLRSVHDKALKIIIKKD